MQLARIRSNLCLGSCPRRPEDIDRLQMEYWVTAVINLQTDQDLQQLGVQWDEIIDFYKARAIEIVRQPVKDHDPVALRQSLPECARLLDFLLRMPHTVYVHCTVGYYRSATVVLAWLIWRDHLQRDDAIGELLSRWGCSPDYWAIQTAARDSRGN